MGKKNAVWKNHEYIRVSLEKGIEFEKQGIVRLF